MILVSKKRLFLLFFISIAGTVGAAVWAFLIVSGVGQKGNAETILFWGLIAGTLEFLGLGQLLLNAGRKRKRLESLAALVRFGGNVADERLDEFGMLGGHVKEILHELSDSSDRKSVRISSLTGLLKTVLEFVTQKIFIISLDGRIVAVSGKILETIGLEDLKVGETKITQIFPDVALGSILEESSRTHSVVEHNERLSFLPAYSASGEISHFVVEIRKEGILGSIASLLHKNSSEGEPSAIKNQQARKKATIFGRLMGIARKKPIASSAKNDGDSKI